MTQAEELALAAEYKAESHPNTRRGEGWCQFHLYDWWIWYCGSYKRIWGAAHLVDSHYTGHIYFQDLREAFEHAKSQP